MLRLTKVERDQLTYDPASVSGPLPTIENLVSPIVRRWDHTERGDHALSGGAIVLEEDRDYYLERGIKIRFPPQDATISGERRYAVGDWWGFAARVATADIDWPSTTQVVGGEPQKVYISTVRRTVPSMSMRRWASESWKGPALELTTCSARSTSSGRTCKRRPRCRRTTTSGRESCRPGQCSAGL